MDVVRVGDQPHADVIALARRYGIQLRFLAPGEPVPGSYWGESEAGLRGDELFVRADTPLHSLLHELSHYVCMSGARRSSLDRDAGGDDDRNARSASCRSCWPTSSGSSVASACWPTWMPGGTPSGWAARAPGSRVMPPTPARGCARTVSWMSPPDRRSCCGADWPALVANGRAGGRPGGWGRW